MKFIIFILALFTVVATWAHTPVCRCELEGQKVQCEGGYHDGSEAAGVSMKVITYNGQILATGQLSKQSRFDFTLPSQPFYVLMDVGPGEMFEVDWRDIHGIGKSTSATDFADRF